MRCPTKILLALTFIMSTGALAFAADRTFYRACCTTDPERHGCGISSWYSSAGEADSAGARHEQATSGHDWTVETITRP